MSATEPSSFCSESLIRESAACAPPAGGDEVGLAALDPGPGGRQLLLLGGDRVARRLDSPPCLGQPDHGPLGLVSELADPPDDRLLEALDPLQVLGPRHQVVEALRREQHGEHVGGAGLIDRDELLAQVDQGRLQVAADDLQVVAGPPQVGDRLVELGLLGDQLRVHGGLLAAEAATAASRPEIWSS